MSAEQAVLGRRVLRGAGAAADDDVEPMLTMLPWPCSSIRAPNSWTHSIVPLMSTARTWSIDSSVMSRHDICSRATSPTLFTRTSTPPSCSNAASAIALTCAQSTMSAWSRTGVASLGRTRSAVCFAPLGRAAVVHADGARPLLGGAYGDLGAEPGAGPGDDDRPALEATRDGKRAVSARRIPSFDGGRRMVRRARGRRRRRGTCPVMKPARSETRKVTASATSSGRPSRSAGTNAAKLLPVVAAVEVVLGQVGLDVSGSDAR